MAKNDGAEVVAAAGIIGLLWFWWQNRTAKPLSSAASGSGGHSCGSCSAAPGSTTPATPAGPTTRRGKLKGGPAKPVLSIGAAALVPAPAPGGNTAASGNGGNWQGAVTNTTNNLAGTYAPSSPAAPVGNGVWQAHTRNPGVSGS